MADVQLNVYSGLPKQRENSVTRGSCPLPCQQYHNTTIIYQIITGNFRMKIGEKGWIIVIAIQLDPGNWMYTAVCQNNGRVQSHGGVIHSLIISIVMFSVN